MNTSCGPVGRLHVDDGDVAGLELREQLDQRRADARCRAGHDDTLVRVSERIGHVWAVQDLNL
ncbi:MAG: hypothetical protein WEA75_13115 [Acidimicrobiia bacterium]